MNLHKKIEKPWGFEEVVEINSLYMLKKLTMWTGHRCSLQYHNTKRETIYILSGVLKITQGPNHHEMSSDIYKAGDTLTIPPGLIHRMEGVEDAVYLEASTPEIDDVVRLSDDYERK